MIQFLRGAKLAPRNNLLSDGPTEINRYIQWNRLQNEKKLPNDMLARIWDREGRQETFM
jgi:hypothetical protein